MVKNLQKLCSERKSQAGLHSWQQGSCLQTGVGLSRADSRAAACSARRSAKLHFVCNQLLATVAMERGQAAGSVQQATERPPPTLPHAAGDNLAVCRHAQDVDAQYGAALCPQSWCQANLPHDLLQSPHQLGQPPEQHGLLPCSRASMTAQGHVPGCSLHCMTKRGSSNAGEQVRHA